MRKWKIKFVYLNNTVNIHDLIGGYETENNSDLTVNTPLWIDNLKNPGHKLFWPSILRLWNWKKFRVDSQHAFMDCDSIWIDNLKKAGTQIIVSFSWHWWRNQYGCKLFVARFYISQHNSSSLFRRKHSLQRIISQMPQIILFLLYNICVSYLTFSNQRLP